MRIIPTSLIGAALGCSVAVANAPDLTLDAPASMFSLSSTMTVSVSGHELMPTPLRFALRHRAQDMSAYLRVTPLESESEDANGDQLLDWLHASFALEWTGLPMAAGDVLEVSVTADAAAGPIADARGVVVMANVTIAPGDAFASEPHVRIHVPVEQHDLASLGESLTVRLDGVDITGQVQIDGPVVVTKSVTPSFPPVIEYQYSYYEVELGAVPPAVGAKLELTLSVATSKKTCVAVATLEALSPNAVSSADDMRLKEFVKALKLTRDANGNVCVKGSAKAIQAAAANLVASGIGNMNNYKLDCEEEGFTIVITIGAGDSHAKGSADAVIALGRPGSGGAGKSATATNSKAGGAAVAVGGDGGATQTSAGDGGGAEASSQGTLSGTSVAIGGSGGDPTENEKQGGNGGAAKSSAGESISSEPGGEGTKGHGHEAGTHGLGGTAIKAKGITSGSAGRSEKNE